MNYSTIFVIFVTMELVPNSTQQKETILMNLL
jgi:hypothetical protein